MLIEECQNCGKKLHPKIDTEFCTGCGALIKPMKVKKREAARKQVARGRNKMITRKSHELEIRARALMIGFFSGFFITLFVCTILQVLFLLALLITLGCSFLSGIILLVIISRANLDIKHAFNDAVSVIPVGDGLKGFAESLSSALPFLGQLPQDD
ncbi:MAG TPA: hypothetical protein PLN69_08435 [bacterium]|nr:hypothetical protein [bacterium]